MLITNPLASPFFPAVAYVLAALLGGTLLALVAIYRGDLARMRSSVLFQRWSVWVWIAPVYMLAVLSGDLTTLLMVAALTFQGTREYARLVGLPKPYSVVLPAASLAAAPAALVSFEAFLALPVLLFIAATLLPIVASSVSNGVRQLAFTALGWGYLAWLPAHLLTMRTHLDGGDGALLVLGLGVALSDVCAFTVGKKFGRRKLAPRISPNKTVEGLAGNVIGAGAGVALMAFALPAWLTVAGAVLLALAIAVTAVWGDLFESAIKREFGAKDAGAWLPGFGGLLDRIDSLVIAAPAAFYVLYLLERW